MAIYNLGSINIDNVYRVQSLPRAGETLAAKSLTTGLGGKGANQSIAIAKAGGMVRHVGAVGPGADWALDQLREADVDTDNVQTLLTPTGHAVINVDDEAENAIVLFVGANGEISEDQIDDALEAATAGDWLLLQNETNGGLYAAHRARAKGMKIAYSAAPFSKQAVEEILPLTDLLIVNQIEAQAVRDEIAGSAEKLAAIATLVTLGKAGSKLSENGQSTKADAYKVDAVDTTGAGDTYLGYFLASIDAGLSAKIAMQRASAASAIQVTREGAADAIPELDEVLQFLEQHS